MVSICGLSWLKVVSVVRCYVVTRQAMYIQPNNEARQCNIFLQWKSSKYYLFWVCICSLRYPACNARAPYCHLWPAPFYCIFPHYLKNGTVFENTVIGHTMCVCSVGSTDCQYFIIMFGGRSSFVIERSVLFCDVGCMIGE